jgi:hypothetical protein
MAEQLNNLQILDESGLLRGLNPTADTLKITTPFEVGAPMSVTADVSITGDLTVAGDIVSRGSVNVVSKDPVIDLGLGDYTGTAQSGGFTVQTNKAAGFTALTITAFQSKADAAGDANFTVADATTLSVGMVIAITSAVDGENDGYYVVKSKAGGVVSIEPSTMDALPFAQTDFKTSTEPGDPGKAYNVNLSVILVADGVVLKQTSGTAYAPGTLVAAYIPAATKALFQADGAYQAASDVTLNEAYKNGATITTSAANGGDVVIAGDQALSVTATGGVSITNTLDLNGTFDADLTGAFTVDNAVAVSFGASTAVSSFGVTTGSAGNIALTAAGAFDVSASGAVEIDAASASYIKATAANLTVETTSTGILDLKSATEVQVSTLLLDVNASGAVEINAAAASNFSVAAAGLKLETTTSGTLWLAGAALVDLDAAADLDIDVTGTFDMLSTGAFSIDGTGASNVSASAGNLTLSTLTSGDVIVTAVAKVDVGAANVDIDASSAVHIGSAAASDFTVAGANLLLTTTGSGDLQFTSAGKIDAQGSSVEFDGTSESYFKVTGNNLLLQTLTSGELDLTSAGLMDVNAGAGLDIDVVGSFDMLASTTVSIAGTGNSKFEITSGNLGIVTKTSGNLTVDAEAGQLTLAGNGAVSMVSDTAGVSITGSLDSAFVVNTAGQSVKVEALGGGAQKASLLSAGTGVNALELTASAGGVDINSEKGLTLDGKLSSNFTVTANDAADQGLTLKATNSGAGKSFVSIESEEGIALKSTAGQSVVQRVGTGGMILEVKKDNNIAFTVADAQIESAVSHKFAKVAGVELQANAGASVVGGTICAFDSTGKMISANAVAGSNTPSAQDEVTRYPFAAANFTVSADGRATFASVPGTMISLKFDAAPSGGIVGQAVFLGAGANAGKATLTAPITSNASIWRVGILGGTVADGSGNYLVYWHPQYLGRRPVA